MAYVSNSDMIKLVANYCGMTQAVIAEVREAESYITQKLLKEGHSVKFANLGTFRLQEMAARKAQIFKMPQTGEIKEIPEKPPYQKPVFNFVSSFRDTIKKITEDKLL